MTWTPVSILKSIEYVEKQTMFWWWESGTGGIKKHKIDENYRETRNY